MMDKNEAKKILNTPSSDTDILIDLLAGNNEHSTKKFIEKEHALYNYYGLEYIPYQNARALSIAMACEKFKCFKSPCKKVGRPAKWKGEEGIKLYLRVILKGMEYPEDSRRTLINKVKTQYKYKGSVDTLYTRFDEIKKDKNIKSSVRVQKQILCNIADETNNRDLIISILRSWAE